MKISNIVLKRYTAEKGRSLKWYEWVMNPDTREYEKVLRYVECTATDSEEKIQKVTMTYPLRKDVLKSEEMSNAVLEYRWLYDCTKKDIHYGDIMMKYGVITKTGVQL